ncbi:hypothetical protein L1987_06699 [Smallanthus sonchifolius]|uniref:Uncharacterized protein n=1 Tax=Smallanthus sonchifolius TaxID=185202 RepID=A0ACB9JZ25_9ASTR|nr:hypothetical protein L1987_06699 [Smallanthus sonchifolius]
MDEERSNMKEEDKKFGLNLDSEFKKVQVDEKVMDCDIGGKDSVLKEIDYAFKINDSDIGQKVIEREVVATLEVNNTTEPMSGENTIMVENDEDSSTGMENSMDEELENKQDRDNCGKGKKAVEVSCAEASGLGRYKYKVRRNGRLTNKALSRFTNTENDPICLDTVEKDCFNFTMDFLMCFLVVMVECHGQGRCKEKILDKLTGETDFSKINWCAYIMDSMRSCNKRWKRDDRSVPFSGPLAILTLLYVDSIDCKGIKMD